MSQQNDIFQTALSLKQLREYLLTEEKPDAPLSYLISQGDCSGEILDKTLKIRATFKMIIFKREWIQVLSPHWTIEVNHQTDFICNQKGAILPRKTGPLTVEITGYVTGDRQSFQLWFPIPLTFQLLLHKRGITPIFSQSLLVKQSEREVTAALPQGEITFSWSAKERENESQETRLSIVDESILIPGYRGVMMESTLRCQVEQGGLFQVTIPFLKGRLLHLSGGSHYRIFQGDDPRIEVYFNRAVTDETVIQITTEYSFFKEIEPLNVLEARRQTGFLVVRQESGRMIDVTDMRGGKRCDLRTLPKGLKSGAIFAAYRWFTPYQISITQIDHIALPVMNAVVEGAHTKFVLSEQGRWLVSVEMRIKNGGRPFLKLNLPDSATILSAFLNNKPVKPVQGNGKIMLPILRSNASGKMVTLEFSYLVKNAILKRSGEIMLPLGAYDIPINRYFCSCYLPDQVKYDRFKGDLEHVAQFKEFIFAPPPMRPVANMTQAGGYSGDDLKKKSAKRRAMAKEMDFDEDSCDDFLMDEVCEEPMCERAIPEPEPMVQSAQMKISSLSSGSIPPMPKMSKISRKRGMKKGLLPVKVELETEGTPLRFQRFWVTEPIQLKWCYRRIKRWFDSSVKPLDN